MRLATSKQFDSSENREKFRLPAHIRDTRITGGRLSVSSPETQTVLQAHPELHTLIGFQITIGNNLHAPVPDP
jgi:hypothetical protein